ncbi:MAG: response regulator [Caulobacter sp.]|nr:response regulator [Caulobacter sp.]
MPASPKPPWAKVNFEDLSIVVVDDNQQALDIMIQVITGFGAKKISRCLSADEARKVISDGQVDMVITDAMMPTIDGYDLTRWIRREAPEHNRFTPVIVVTGHTPRRDVVKARDCGANYIIAKPITPKTIMDRILWVAREDRMGIDCDAYVGPDRRFRRLGPPAGMAGRRSGDLNDEIGAAVEPNMSQDQIDTVMKPQKVTV